MNHGFIENFNGKRQKTCKIGLNYQYTTLLSAMQIYTKISEFFMQLLQSLEACFIPQKQRMTFLS